METNNIKYSLIQQYLEGKLDPKAMHELEKQALEDPFLAEAIEGYSSAGESAYHNLSILQRQLEERVVRNDENKSIFYFTWQRLSVAAAAGLMFVSAGILFWMKGSHRNTQLAVQKHVEVKLTPADSLGMQPDAAETGRNAVLADSLSSDTPIARADAGKEIFTIQSQKVASAQNKQQITVLSARVVDTLRRALNGQGTTDNVPVQTSGISSSALSEPGDTSAVIHGSAAYKTRTISGKVSKDGGEPLPGVHVKREGGGSAATTNAEGMFALADSTSGNVSFAAPGYEPQVRRVEAGEPVVVIMRPSHNTSAAATTSSRQARPEPVSGWNKYNIYLRENIKLAKDKQAAGTVVVRFKVNSSGILSGFSIEKGLNEACNREAVRLIEEGPAWRSGSGKDTEEVQVTVSFGK